MTYIFSLSQFYIFAMYVWFVVLWPKVDFLIDFLNDICTLFMWFLFSSKYEYEYQYHRKKIMSKKIAQ